jgi:hypothetical protein
VAMLVCRMPLSTVSVAALLSACAIADAAAPVEPEPPTLPAALQAIVPPMLDDAALRTRVARDRVRVVSARPVLWSDGSMGCPQPGRLYTQALVPGWRIEIASAAAAAPLIYHVGQRGSWIWCPAERAVPGLPAAEDPRI